MLPRTHGVRLALALTLALAAAGLCSIQAATAMPTLRISYVRALHLVPNGPLFEVFADGLEAPGTLAYVQETPFLAVPAGRYHVQLFTSGTPYSPTGGLINTHLSIAPGVYYSAVAVGAMPAPSAWVLSDTAAMSNVVTLRFAAAAANAPPVDLEAQGSGLVATNVGYRQASGYTTSVPAGTHVLIVHPAGSPAALLRVSGVTLLLGHVYTIYLDGFVGGAGTQALSILYSDDTHP